MSIGRRPADPVKGAGACGSYMARVSAGALAVGDRALPHCGRGRENRFGIGYSIGDSAGVPPGRRGGRCRSASTRLGALGCYCQRRLPVGVDRS